MKLTKYKTQRLEYWKQYSEPFGWLESQAKSDSSLDQNYYVGLLHVLQIYNKYVIEIRVWLLDWIIITFVPEEKSRP